MEQGNGYEGLSGSQLVTVYNAMAEQLGIATVKRFSDSKTGLKRCEELRAKLREAGTDPERKEEPEATGVALPNTGATSPLIGTAPHTVVVEEVVTAPPAPVAKTKTNKEPCCKECLEMFQARAGTIREKILKVLCENINNQVALPLLIEAGYGENGAAGAAAINMVLKGVKAMIDKHKLKMELRRTNSGKIQQYGLHQIADQSATSVAA